MVTNNGGVFWIFGYGGLKQATSVENFFYIRAFELSGKYQEIDPKVREMRGENVVMENWLLLT